MRNGWRWAALGVILASLGVAAALYDRRTICRGGVCETVSEHALAIFLVTLVGLSGAALLWVIGEVRRHTRD